MHAVCLEQTSFLLSGVVFLLAVRLQKLDHFEHEGRLPRGPRNVVPVSGDLGVRSLKLDLNSSPTQVGTHGEVSNGGHHSDSCSDVVENSLVLVLLERHADEGASADNHHSTYCEVPIASSDGDVVVSSDSVDHRVGHKGVVTLEDRHVGVRVGRLPEEARSDCTSLAWMLEEGRDETSPRRGYIDLRWNAAARCI